MYVDIEGGTASQKFYVESIMRFCHEKLMPRMKSLIIDVYIKNFGSDDSCGYCMPIDSGKNPRHFAIELSKTQRLRALLETVAHEMVHVKQYAKNELHEYTMKKGHRYKGEFFSDKLNYWDEPWEIEAHGRETGLFVRWAEKHKLGKRKWTQDPGEAQ